MNKIKEIFFNKHFFFFVIIGIINTIDVTWMSLAYSLIVNQSLAFVFGWTTSLIVAYILNSIFNFKEKLSFNKLLKFAISNVPNFLIQVTTAFVILEIFKTDKLISYLISAIIGVPITFICIIVFVFDKKN